MCIRDRLKAVLDANPNDVEANLTLGSLYVSAGPSDPNYYKEAIKTADVLLDGSNLSTSDRVKALILKGNALAGAKDFEKSVEILESAKVLDPKNVTVWITLGTTRVFEKNFPEAEKAFLGAREANPKDPNAYTSLANFYRVAGNPGKAESIFTEALSLFPQERSVYSQAAEFYLQSGRLEDVERTLKTAQANNK